MSANHTPGPWTVARAGWTDEGSVWYALEGVKEACAPDARLIASAPDLYAYVATMAATGDTEAKLLLQKINGEQA